MFNECFRKPCGLCENVGKYATARQATNKNMIAYGAEKMRFTCRITKARIQAH